MANFQFERQHVLYKFCTGNEQYLMLVVAVGGVHVFKRVAKNHNPNLLILCLFVFFYFFGILELSLLVTSGFQ